ncbi:MAG TPA: hypothetical protein VGM63_23295 [Mucilaginibacter sp.]|jgi:uncharacterized membrane protein
MNILYVIGGVIALIYGVWQTIITLKVFIEGKQDWLGADIKLLVAGLGSIAIGIFVIIKYI